jgi:hypothetical protein
MPGLVGAWICPVFPGDKKSRGAFRKVRFDAPVCNVMPPGVCEIQYTLSNGTRRLH